MITRLPVTKALIALITDSTGHPCGHGRLPTAEGNPLPPPYYVVHALPFVPEGAPMTDLNEDACLYYQVTCVAEQDDQAESMADRLRTVVLGRDPVTLQWTHPLTVDGARCYRRRADTDAGITSVPADVIVTYVIRFSFDFTSTR
jgi:hypothetical protein